MPNTIQNPIESKEPQDKKPPGFMRRTRGWVFDKDLPEMYKHTALPGGRNELYGGQGYDFGSPQDEGDTDARLEKVADEQGKSAA